MTDLVCKTDINALVLFQKDGENYWVSPATLAQCLAIAAHTHRLPELDPGWLRAAVPEALWPGSREKLGDKEMEIE